MTKNEILLPWKGHEIAATEFLPEDIKTDVVIMHGAGMAGQERFTPLAQALARAGCRTITFDFMSHGLSTGSLGELNLEVRQEQAEFVINKMDIKDEFTLVGFSMSGQTGIDVANGREVANLVLFAPAVYDQAARRAHFGQESEFTQLIRRPQSWMDTDAWDKLSRYDGRLAVLQAENDNVIPADVPKLIFEHADKAQERLHILLRNMPHMLGKLTQDDPEAAAWCAQIIANFVQNQPLPESTRELRYQILAAK